MTTEAQEQQFDDTPAGLARRWHMELEASRKEMKTYWEQGEKALRRFRDERDAAEERLSRLNLYSSGIITQRAMMYGKTPTVSAERRFADAQDDLARVGAEMLERHLNCDVEKDDDTYAEALGHALDDRLIPGLGQCRIRYEAEFEDKKVEPIMGEAANDDVEAPKELAPGYSQEVKSYEAAHVDYVHWRDFMWSAGSRVWSDVRWVSFESLMGRKALIKRFGDIGKLVPLNAKKNGQAVTTGDAQGNNPWGRAKVYEIWSKEDGKVYWFVEGHREILDVKDDPLQLEGFWPCPRPLLANVTTSSLVPKPDLALALDLYNEIDELSTRIRFVVQAIKVRGVHDKAQGELATIFKGPDLTLVGVDNWAALAEKGGLSGVLDFLPLDMLSAALDKLRAMRAEQMELLYQVTGMSDIMRGQAADASTSATEQSIKAKFGSVRIQAMQDEFARFASDVQKLKAEVIAKHYDAETIKQHSNIMMTADAQMADAAIEMLKGRFADYRVQVKPENVSLTDFAALKQERTEIITAIGGYLQQMVPALQAMGPTSMPFMLEILQWMVAGLRGASGIENILDRAIVAAQQAAQAQAQQPQQPDPKVVATKMKGQQDIAKIDKELSADLVRMQAEVQAEGAKQEMQAKWNIREEQARSAFRPPPQAKPTGGVKK